MNSCIVNLRGVKDWQIFQQIDGFAVISINGEYLKDHEEDIVWARIMDETMNMPIIDWSKAQMTTEGTFNIVFNAVPSGGLYRIETCMFPFLDGIRWGKYGDMIFHIGVGDLYVIAGQSNASGFSKTPANDPPEIGIHLYKNSEIWDLATHPMNDSTNTVHGINADFYNPGHSPFLAFAKQMKSYLNYPIGLIQTAQGGSPLSEWHPRERGNLYRNMVNVINKATNGQCKIAGILWYQGCQDICEDYADHYFERCIDVFETLRSEMDSIELPIYTVQLNKMIGNAESFKDETYGCADFILDLESYEPKVNENLNKYFSLVKEAQRSIARKMNQVYIIPSLDLEVEDGIHNTSVSNIIIGQRLANIALSQTFGKGRIGKAPDINKAKMIDDNKLLLVFDNMLGLFMCHNLPAGSLQFEVVDELGHIKIVGYECISNTINLKLERGVKGETFVSFAATTNPNSIVPYDQGSGLPILSFYRVKVVK